MTIANAKAVLEIVMNKQDSNVIHENKPSREEQPSSTNGVDFAKLEAAIKRRKEHEAQWEHPWSTNGEEKLAPVDFAKLEAAIKRRKEHEAQWEHPWSTNGEGSLDE